MDEVMMVPVNEFKQLENYYKGHITECIVEQSGSIGRGNTSHIER